MMIHPEFDIDDDFDEYEDKELSTDEIEALEDKMAREALEDEMLSSFHW